MKAISLNKGFHISLSATRHRLSARYRKYSFFLEKKSEIQYFQQISGFTLIRNIPIKPANQAGYSFTGIAKKQTTKKRKPE